MFCQNRDCAGDFGAWSKCTKQCGGGTKYRVYSHTQKAGMFGKACPCSETNIASKKSVTKMNVYYQTFAKDVGKSPNLAVPSAAAERRPEHFS